MQMINKQTNKQLNVLSKPDFFICLIFFLTD